MLKNIELEYRATVPFKRLAEIKKKLSKLSKKSDTTKRVSFMSFGKIDSNVIDIRIRMTNGVSEFVIKKGDLHSHNRIEQAEAISNSQFLGFVNIVNLFGFDNEIAVRNTENFYLKDDITASLVTSGRIVYIEIEKMSHSEEIEKNSEKINSLFAELNLEQCIIKDEKSFMDLCNLLSKKVDWKYKGTKSHLNKLEKLLLANAKEYKKTLQMSD